MKFLSLFALLAIEAESYMNKKGLNWKSVLDVIFLKVCCDCTVVHLFYFI